MKQFNPYLLAKQEKALEGTMSFIDLSRVYDQLKETNSKPDELTVSYWISAKINEDGFCCIEGTTKVPSIELTCQRCLGTVTTEINSEFRLVAIKSEQQEDEIPQGYEAILVDSEELSSIEQIVEDEILLSLPIVPKHEDEQCQRVLAEFNNKEKAANHPFKDLTLLKTAKTKGESDGSTKE